MPKVLFEHLKFNRQKRFKNLGWTRKENTGLDTETYKGYVKLICDDSGRKSYPEDFMDIVNFLTHERFRLKFNWFYNIKFDFESIVKFLEKSELQTLYVNHTIDINSYQINYLDKKFFSIRDKSNHYYYFYDLYNFLDTSLDKASKKFLKDEKLKVVDAARLNLDINYWQSEKLNIEKYCIYDAQLTKRLADYFWNLLYANMQYAPKRPFSKGKLAEEYFLARCYIPTVNNYFINQTKDFKLRNNAMKFAYNSYSGGRFELIQRGYFDKVYTYDIKSAYPAEIANLIDYTKGEWKKVEPRRKYSEDALNGFYYVQIDCQETYFCPVLQKNCELSLYPNGRFKQYLAKRELDFIASRFPNVSVKILGGYEYYNSEPKYPFKVEIERLYEWKEKELDQDIKYAVKIILNSLYGKTIQINDNNLPGKLFNPIYASTITSNARMNLLELACQKPDAIIMFSTDGVHSTEPLKVPNNPKMGEFAKDFSGQGVYLMSDVYNLWNDTKTKNKLRGFSLASEKDITSGEILLKDILANMNTPEYHYTTKRPYHLGECLLHIKKRTIEDLNVFGDVEKSININGDRKRIWDKNFINGKQALKENIMSLPLVV